MTEYVIRHKRTSGWSSITIDEVNNTLAQVATADGTVSTISRDNAELTILYCASRPTEFTVEAVQGAYRGQS